MSKIPLGQYSYLFEGESLNEDVKLSKDILKALEKAYIEIDVAFKRYGISSSKDRDIVDMMKAMKKVIQKNK